VVSGHEGSDPSCPDTRGQTPHVVIAIDGPAGAGKSTVGRALADELGIDYLDTGAMYRAVTYAVLRRGVDPTDADAVADVAISTEFEVVDVDGRTRVTIDGLDATTEIRSRDVTASVSAVAAISEVRAVLVERQRQWVAERGGGVVEGRDIGSVVFPDARLKLYVTASPRVRAERRVAEIGGDVNDVEASIVERDRKDSSRVDSPLREASGSTVVDTTGMSIDEVVAHIRGLLSEARVSSRTQ
jgi:CMP/dCMP kinase